MAGTRWRATRSATALLLVAGACACGASPLRRPRGVRPLEGFSTGHDWTMGSVLEALRAHELRLQQVPDAVVTVGDACFPDPERVPADVRCLVAPDGVFFEAPYLGWGRPTVHTRDGSFHVETGWARPDQVADGAVIARAIRERARHSDFSCEGEGSATCSVFLRSYGGQAELLQECRLVRINGVPGAPEDCLARALFIEHMTYLPVMLRVLPGLPPTHRLVEQPEMSVIRSPPPTTAALLLLAKGVLEAEPLALTLRREQRGEQGSVVGVANRRASSILRGWHETLTVRVNVSFRSRGEGRSLTRVATFHVSPTIYVNRGQVERVREWTRPNVAQLRRYYAAITRAFESRMPQLCRHASWPRPHLLSCSR